MEPPLKKRAVTLYAIIIFKLFKALLCMALAAAIYHEANKNLSEDWRPLPAPAGYQEPYLKI